ncbi:MAG: hypothetical protein D6729_10615 [Deltaproteobacteria bacterium]|nr:MAG: hypothetical protein D6729_10615 [Deltaproteobacteria bacterium]
MRTRPFILSLLVALPFLSLAAGCPFTRDHGGRPDAGIDGGGDGGGLGPEGIDYPGTCSDGIDNDGNGLTDCEDLVACSAAAACEATGVYTIYQIQNEADPLHPAPDSLVTIEDVIVTAVRSRTRNDGTRYWEAFVEEPDGGAWSAILVTFLDQEVQVGDRVSVTGTYAEFFGMSRIEAQSVTVAASGEALPMPEAVDPAEVATGAALAENYEAVLVEVGPAEIVETPVPGSDGVDRGDFRITGGLIVGHAFETDIAGLRAVGLRFQSIVGVLWYSFDEMRLEPRSNEDITLENGSHPGPIATTIYAIQDPSAPEHPQEGAAVALSGVVVTALSAPDAMGRIHLVVEEPAGGAYSGIYVYNRDGLDLSALTVGDLVDVSAEYTEFAFSGDTDTVSELVLRSLTKTGSGIPPAPQVLDVAAFADPAEAEKWEGVLIQVENVTVTEGPNQYDEFVVGGTLKVDDLLWPDAPLPQVGDTFLRLTGIGHYNFGYALLPRGPEDVEAGMVQPTPVVSVYDLQDPTRPDHPAPDTQVRLEGVVVSAIGEADAMGRAALAVQEEAGGTYSGIYVHNPTGIDLTAFSVGDRVNLEGRYTEFAFNGDTDTASEIVLSSIEQVAPGSAPSPAVVTTAELAAAGGEAWEGVLITVENVTVATDTNQFGVFEIDDGILVDDTLYRSMPAQTAGSTFTSLTGIVHWNFGRTLLPRGAADLVP